MAKTAEFSNDELKLLLVAVRHMRRAFAPARRTDAALESYAALYDRLFDKLRDLAGPLPSAMDEFIE